MYCDMYQVSVHLYHDTYLIASVNHCMVYFPGLGSVSLYARCLYPSNIHLPQIAIDSLFIYHTLDQYLQDNDNDIDKVFYSTLIIHFIFNTAIDAHIKIRYWVRRQNVKTKICHWHTLPPYMQ